LLFAGGYICNKSPGEYFLWVAACHWQYSKGLDVFMRLAADNPDLQFVTIAFMIGVVGC
jgi:hypothetical protein